MEATRPFPAAGKVAAVFGTHSTECRLSLPAAPTKASSAVELAAHGWLTVGNLAADSIALQVRFWLQRTPYCCSTHVAIVFSGLPQTCRCGWPR